MQLGRQGKFRGGKHIPHYKRPLNIGVQAVAVIVGQAQLGAGEIPRLLSQGQALLEFWVGSRVLQQLGNRLARLQQVQLPAGQVAVVVQGAAAVQQQRSGQRNPAPEQSVEHGSVPVSKQAVTLAHRRCCLQHGIGVG